MDHFMNLYEIISAYSRKQYMINLRKQQRDENEEALRRKQADRKKAQRQKEKEKDEDAHRRQMADQKRDQRQKEKEKDEDAQRSKMAEEKQSQRMRKQEQTDKTTRINNFNRAVIFGPIFTCSCCYRQLYENGVTKITEKFKDKLNTIDKMPYSKVIPSEQEIYIDIMLNGSTSLSGHYICHTCKTSLLKGKLPAMAVQNGLQLSDIPEDCELTELENNLIAQMINFQYIYQLPKSRWAATKKQMISVPVSLDTVQEVVSQLPRLPKDSGLIPVNLKRKKEYNNAHKKELIDPERTMRCLQNLKTSGHPYYQFCDDFNLDTYKERCKDQDQQGYDLLFGKDADENTTNENLGHIEELDGKHDDGTGLNVSFGNEKEDIISDIEDKGKETREDNSEMKPGDEYDVICMQCHVIKDNILTIDIKKGDGTCMQVIIDKEKDEEEIYAQKGANEKDTVREVDFLLRQLYLKAYATAKDLGYEEEF